MNNFLWTLLVSMFGFMLGALLVMSSMAKFVDVQKKMDWSISVCSNHQGVKVLGIYSDRAMCNDGTEISK